MAGGPCGHTGLEPHAGISRCWQGVGLLSDLLGRLGLVDRAVASLRMWQQMWRQGLVPLITLVHKLNAYQSPPHSRQKRPAARRTAPRAAFPRSRTSSCGRPPPLLPSSAPPRPPVCDCPAPPEEAGRRWTWRRVMGWDVWDGAVYAHSLRSAKAYTVGYSALMECKTARARYKTVYLARLAMDPGPSFGTWSTSSSIRRADEHDAS